MKNNNLHIVYLCNEYPPSKGGGVGTFTQTIARQLVQLGCKVTVLGYYPVHVEVVEMDSGVQVIRMPVNLTPMLNIYINAIHLHKRLMQIHQLEPVHIIESSEMGFGALPRNTPGIKIIRMHGGHHFFSSTLGRSPKRGRAMLEKNSFRKADFLCAVSRFVADTTRTLIKLADRPIEIIPNPVDVDLFKPMPSILEEPGLICFVGTICEKKGIRQLIEAMPEILDAIPQVHLVAIGRDGRDTQTGENYRIQLQSRVPAKLQDQIVFQGPVPHSDLPAWLARSQVCVYPSHMEAMPIAWLEGLSMGKAVVASQTGPGSELIEDGINGLLCNPYDPHSIAQKVIRILHDNKLRRELGKNARSSTVEKYSLTKIAELNLDYYHHCLTRETS